MNLINTTLRLPPQPKDGIVSYPVVYKPNNEQYHRGLMAGAGWNGKEWVNVFDGKTFGLGIVVQWADPNQVVETVVNITEVKTVDDGTYTVLLTGFKAENKMAIIKLIRELTGLGLGESKAFVEKSAGTPVPVKDSLVAVDAEALTKKIVDAGGLVERKAE